MKYPKVPDARQAMNPTTSAERVVLYEAALREMERERDNLASACEALRKLMNSHIAARDRDLSGQASGRPPSLDAVDPVPGVVAEVRRATEDSSSLPSTPAAPHPARTEEP